MSSTPRTGARVRAALYVIGTVVSFAGWNGALPAAIAQNGSNATRVEAWQNQARRWGSGAQAGNSSYAEDRVIPVRWVGTLKAGSVNTLLLRYDFATSSGGRFFDSLATYDATEIGVNLAQGVTLVGAPLLRDFPADATLPPGAQMPGRLVAHNVSSLSFGAYTTVNGVRGIPITFKVAGASGNQTVVIAYGAHLASGVIWGFGKGAFVSPGASGKAYTRLNTASEQNVPVNPDALSPSADLSLALSGPSQAYAGDDVTYRIRASNLGPNAATAVRVSDTLPVGATLIGTTTSLGTVAGTGPVVFSLGDLAPGVSVEMDVTVRYAATAAGTAVHQASIASSTPDPVTANNTASVSTLVRIRDILPPTIACPGDITQATDAGACGATVTFPVSASDETSAVTLSVQPPSGSVFPKGSTTVRATATDASGNVASCSFQVIVVDREPPRLVLPADITVDAAPGRCDRNVAFALVPATDNCDGHVAVSSDVPPGSAFPIGATVVTLRAVDEAGNTATGSFTVTVKDDPNDSWPNARALALASDPTVPGLSSVADRQCLTRLDQSRWYRFRVQPGSTLVVTLSELAANYDLAVFKDIRAAYDALVAETDLSLLSAAFAGDAFSPAQFSPDALSPAQFSPAAFSPAAFSPAQFSPAAFSPAQFSPAAFSPAQFSPDAYAPAQFSPAQFSPAAFSPAQFSPAAFSPAQFSPAAFSDAQLQSVIGVSAFEGTAPEGVVVKTWDSAGDFYVRVRGRNGLYLPGAPFLVQAYLYAGTCGNLQLTAVDAGGHALRPTEPAFAGGFRTLILTDPARWPNDGKRDALAARLAALAARPEVKGRIVHLDADPRVAFFQAQADAKLDCPTAKNLVAAAIKQVVDEWWAANPDLANIVLVGGDAVIPFFRYPDESLLGPERNYVPPVLDFSASQASLRWNYVLGQDAYGSRCDVPRATTQMPIPQLAVGRLVENPGEMIGLLDAYLETSDGVVAPPTSALVTGYDFLTDAAEAVRDELTAGLGRPIDTLLSPANKAPAESWTAQDLRDALFSGRHDLIFLAGHFSAFGALAADFTTFITASELEAATDVDFKNTLVFSAGCHSGYNAVDGDGIRYVTPEPDWAQACARRQVTLLAGTGYQYGDTDFIEYSERIYLGFVRQLRRGTGPVSVGEALVRSKRHYLATTPSLRGLHEKALIEAALFGLPMLRIDLPAGRLADPHDPDAPEPLTLHPDLTPAGSVLGLAHADLTVTPQFSAARTLPLNDFENGGQVFATYFEGRDGILNNPAEPILPLEVRNLTQPGTLARGVGFRGGDYEDLPGFMPLTGAAATEIRGVHVGFPTEVFFPIQPWGLNYFDAACSPGADVTRLSVAAAQFRVEAATDVAGTLRRFDRLQFRVFYNNNLTTYPGAVPSTPGRSGPPSISGIFATSAPGRIHFSARVTGNPAAGVPSVWVTYTATQGPLYGTWQSLDLTQTAPDTDSTLWAGDLALDGLTAPADVRYMVQAVNGVGLVALHTRQGRYHVPDFNDGWADANATPTTVALVDPPATATFGQPLTVRARLTAHGQSLDGFAVVFQIADQQATARVVDGVATATLNIATLPGGSELKVTYPGGFGYASSWAASPVDIQAAATRITFTTPNAIVAPQNAEPLVALLTDGAGTPIGERTVLFVVQGGSTALVRPIITDYAGRARLGSLPLPSGNYGITAHFAAMVPNLPGSGVTVDLRDPRYLPGSASTLITVDADAPVVTAIGATPSVLPIPNHKMVAVMVTVAATDAGGAPVSRIVQILSSETENGLGDGDQAPDWEITGALTANLRSERAQNGVGRTYTLIVETRDPVGNSRRDQALVFVPK